MRKETIVAARVSPEQLRKLKAIAVKTDRNLSQVVRALINRAIVQDEPEIALRAVRDE